MGDKLTMEHMQVYMMYACNVRLFASLDTLPFFLWW